MTAASLEYVFLFVCWISALLTLVVFLESWFALSRRSRLATIRSTGTRGVVSVIVPLKEVDQACRRCLQSVLDQSYPFMELLVVYHQNHSPSVEIAREYAALPSHVPVIAIPLPFAIDSEAARIQALDQCRTRIRGSWILVLDPDVVLDMYAVESALEFSGSEEMSAVALSPGIECRSVWQKLLAPSLEWFVRMISVVDRGRERSGSPGGPAAFLLLHGQTHAVINKMNRMPGILNESGWTAWSFKVEGLRTFEGDGSGWIARAATIRSMMSRLDGGSATEGRMLGFALGSAFIAVVSVAGIAFGLSASGEGFSGPGILYFSAFSYGLMATSHFVYSRRLGAAVWFAPLWFVSHALALILTLMELRRAASNPMRIPAPVPRESEHRVPSEKG